MNVKQVADGMAVSEQITVEDVTRLAAEGFRSIICNRPDAEAVDQPSWAQIKLAAGRNGLQFRNVPVVSGGLSQADVDAFIQARRELPGPVLAYCRSGTRSIQLWAIAAASEGMEAAQILTAAREAGYDLSGLQQYLEQLAEKQRKS